MKLNILSFFFLDDRNSQAHKLYVNEGTDYIFA